MKKILFFMSLLIGSLALTACSSSSSENPEDSYENYNYTEFLKYINSQYSGSDKSVVVVECDDIANFHPINGSVWISGFALVKDKNNQYSVDGYRYDGTIKDGNRYKIYNAQKSKAFSLNIDSKSELDFILLGLIISNYRETDPRGKRDNYTIERSYLVDDCIDVTVDNSIVTTRRRVLNDFCIQSRKEITANYPNLIIGKWKTITGKIYEFNADGTVKLDSQVYHYSVSDGSVYIDKIKSAEHGIINLLTDNELQMMTDYTLSAFGYRQRCNKVSQ